MKRAYRFSKARSMPTKQRSERRRSKSGQPDWDNRYADNWRKICAIAHQATGGICCLCLVAASEECHHVRYRDKRGAIAGREVAGRDCFGCCKPCHDRLHRKDAWVYAKNDALLGNHQRSEWVKKLKLGYQLLSTQTR